MPSLAFSSKEFARRIRVDILKMVHAAKASHVGSALSCADIMAVLYHDILHIDPACPTDPDRDRFILSKGHASTAVYATLANAGFFPHELLDTYCHNGSPFAGHVHHHGVPGVEISTGSLGHGLPIGTGMALAAKADGRPSRVFVVLSDGECDEGSNWEAFLFAPHHQLDNLTVIVDYNKIQSFGRISEILELAPFADKLRAFRWDVHEVDGHDHAALRSVLEKIPAVTGRPTVILAHTTKGKGVSFMEDKLLWHYRNPSDEQLAIALQELSVEAISGEVTK